MRVVFMGTPDFAAAHLRALSAAGHDIVCVYTQPDRPKGRGKQMQPSAVKREAQSLNLPVRQPTRLADAREIAWLTEVHPDVIAVVAYGQKVPSEVLSLPSHGCINIHASLLPKYRGAAPIQWAILRGETETGVTAMRMDEGWDTGDILMQRRVPMGSNTDAGTLHDLLAEAGAELLVTTLDALRRGAIRPEPQDDELATFAPKLRKEDGLIDWTAPATEIERRVRALRPWPGAYTMWGPAPLRIWRAELGRNVGGGGTERRGADPGTILSVDERDRGCTVQTGDGTLHVLEVQPANRRKMTALDFANGAHLAPGARFKQSPPAPIGEARG